MTRRSINAHRIVIYQAGGQWSAACRCALMLVVVGNKRADVEREYKQHVKRSERASNRSKQ
jgi:hypothetical protein